MKNKAVAAIMGIIVAVLTVAPEFAFRSVTAAPGFGQSPDPLQASSDFAAATSIQPLQSPEAIARAFRSAPQIQPHAPSVIPAPIRTPTPVIKADWLSPVGMMEDSDGRRFVFVKNGQNGRILKLPIDGRAEDGVQLMDSSSDSYTICIDGSLYSMRRK
jgi:hypothetical protein